MEYQHYIPQFLLRNFSHKFVCPNAEEKQTTGRKGKKCKCRHEKGKFPNDPVLNCINLTTTPLHREVRAVKRVFGLTNMYDDESKPTTAAQRRIEKRFSEMESEASRIIRRMVKAHDAHEQAISLTRIERDFVRKFLFLLKYRGQGYHNRFNHASADKYCADDRNLMVKYMEIHGFKTPLDVWFHSLEAIMDVKMDLQSKWKADLKKIMFPVDAEGFILHIEAYYMAICTPDNPYGEFILTDNCYNIFEGPSSCVRDELTGEIIPSFYAGYHEFAPISPCLIIILRSNLLPNSLEDADPEVRSQRENLRWLAFGQTYGSDNDSLLADLRVHKARASYTRVINGSYHPIQGFDGQYRPNDTFTFPFFPLQARHVTLVNSILLDNAHSCTAIGFRSEEAFFKILESYIAGRSTSLKIIGGLDADLRLRFIERLEGLARDLGSVKPLFICRMGEIPTVDAKGFMRQLERLHGSIWLGEGKDMVSETCGSFVQLYANIGKGPIAT
jgi:hypothetical protein